MPSDRPLRVVIVDDHPLVRERLAQLIAQKEHLQICGEADNLTDARAVIQATLPDIAIVDITLRGSSGLELIKDLKALGLEVPVLVLSMHDEALYAERAFRAGARGYVTKSEASEVILLAMERVLAGEVYASERFRTDLLKNLVETGKPRQGSQLGQLTDRELEVFHLIGQGRTTQEIATALHLGSKTVDTYKTRIKEALQLKNASELHHCALNWVRDMELTPQKSGEAPNEV